MSSIKVTTTARGNVAIQYKNYIFRKDRTLANGEVNWRCLTRTCTASLKTSNDFKTLRSKAGVHNHPSPSTSTTASPAASPPATPTPDHTDTASSDLGTPTPTPSLTELLSPYTTITPAPPKYTCLEEENTYLRQRVAELTFETDALTNKTIELEKQLIEARQSNNSPNTDDSQPHSLNPPPSTNDINTGTCENCQIYKEEVKNMITSIRGLEEDIKTLKQQTVTQHSTHLTSALPLNNSYEILSNTPGDESEDFTMVVNKRNKKQNKSKPVKNNKQPGKLSLSQNKRTRIPHSHVTVLGDSHCRGLASLMTSRTTHHTYITGVCKPGAGLLNIAPTSTSPLNNAYVIIAGTNDVAAGREAVVFQHLEEILQRCRSTSRVLVSPLPPRHDLPSVSPVHESVALVNNFISELCCRYEGMEVLDISSLGRRHFTRHGLHLNAEGKIVMADLIVKELARVSMPPQRRRPAGKPVTVAPSLPSPRPNFAMQHESFADAVKSSSQPSSPLRQTDSPRTKHQPVFLETPHLAT